MQTYQVTFWTIRHGVQTLNVSATTAIRAEKLIIAEFLEENVDIFSVREI